MQTVAILNEKGGTAKTTTSVSLAATLGELGKKVLLVDLDGQAASSRWLGCEEDNRLAEALLVGEGLLPLKTALPNVWLAPASGRLDSISHELRPTQGGQLRRVLVDIQQRCDFDYVLIDCPPSLGNRLIGNALLAATHAIVPVEASILALDGLRILLTMLDDIAAGFGHEIELIGALACRYNSRTKLSRLVLAELQRALPGRVFKTCIRETVRMQECPASGMSILEYAPTCTAATDYQSLAHELVFGSPPANAFTPDVSELLDMGELDEEDKQAVVGFHARAAAHLGCDPAPSVQASSESEPFEALEPEAVPEPDLVLDASMVPGIDDADGQDADDADVQGDPGQILVHIEEEQELQVEVIQCKRDHSCDDDMPSVGEDLVIEHDHCDNHSKQVAVVAGIMLCATLALSWWMLTGNVKIEPMSAAADDISGDTVASVEDASKDTAGGVEDIVDEKAVAAEDAAVEVTSSASFATEAMKHDAADLGVDWDTVLSQAVKDAVEVGPLAYAAPVEPSGKDFPTGLSLMSIMGSDDHRTAIISDKLCSVGGEVNGAKVVSISSDSVEVEYGSFRFVLSSDGSTVWAGPEL